MKEISIVQKLATWTVIILALIIGIAVFNQKEENLPVPFPMTPISTDGPSPTPIVWYYPSEGKQ